jgi:thioesterase domain-containing protein
MSASRNLFLRVRVATPNSGEQSSRLLELANSNWQDTVVPSKASHIPLFLFPGILGFGDELLHFILALIRQEGNSQRPIFVYTNPLLNDPDTLYQQASNQGLAEEVKLIVGAMRYHLPEASFTPFIMVGYSYGAHLAFAAAQQLEAQNCATHLYLIDSPSTTLTRSYFAAMSSQAKSDILAILNYAAKRCLLNPLTIDTASENPTNLTSYIDHTANLLLRESPAASPLHQEKFSGLVQIVKTRLQNLCAYTPSGHEPQSIYVLGTEKTRQKFSSPDGAADLSMGWSRYAKDRHCATTENSSLVALDHHSLLSQPNAPMVAQDLIAFLGKTITDLDLQTARVMQICQDPSVATAVAQLLKRTPPQSTLSENEADSPASSISSSPENGRGSNPGGTGEFGLFNRPKVNRSNAPYALTTVSPTHIHLATKP